MSARKSNSPTSSAGTTKQNQLVKMTGARDSDPPPLSAGSTTQNQLVKPTGAQDSNQLYRRAFTSLVFTADRTDKLVAKFVQKVTVNTPSGSYFGWKGLGFQCGALFLSLPSHVNLNMNSYLMMTGGFSSNMQQMDDSSVGKRKSPPELDATTPLKAPSTVRLLTAGEQVFLRSVLPEKSKYVGVVRHPWLSLLLKMTQPTDSVTLENANIRSCFSILDKETDLSDPWRRVILRRVRKTMWELLDEYGESVLDIVLHRGEKGVIEQWGKCFEHQLSRTTMMQCWQTNSKRLLQKKERVN
jgi:hypothetical protein